MSGLQGGSAYTFMVSALNNFGLGAASSPSSSVTPTGSSSTYASTVLAANFRTTYTPNAYGDRTAVSDPLAHSTSYLYDANRNVTQVTDADGHITTYSFDFDNEVTQEVDASGTASARTIGTGYDANGNAITQTDALSHVTTHAYDVLNRRTSTTDPLSRVTT
jgi:YD repeat-containing protein